MRRQSPILLIFCAITLMSCRLATDTSDESFDLHADTYKVTDALAQTAAEEILLLHAQYSGSTYHLEDGNLFGNKGYAVAVYPERSMTVNAALTSEHIKGFILANQDLLNKGWHAIGTWLDKSTNRSMLDIVSTPSDRDAALAIGVRAKQEYIYDLRTGALLSTGYTPKTMSQNAPNRN